MIVEMAIAGLGMYTYSRFKNRDILELKKTFENIIGSNKLDYKILKVEKNDYGYTVVTSLQGAGFEKLKKLKDKFETGFGHMTFIEQNNNLKTATINIITEKITDTTKYTPIIIRPYEIYFGMSYKYKKLISDLTKFPHVLVSGQTGSGKSYEMMLILTNLIHYHSTKGINIYFSDLSDTQDFGIFKNCKQVKGYAKTIEESEQLFNYLMHIYSKRLNIFGKHNCKNIKEYNKIFFEKRMSYIYLVLDEFADYFPTNKFEDNYNEKVKCYNLLKQMVRKFRKAGIFLIIGIQRPDTTVLDPSLRSGLCTKIGFSQNTDSSSLVVCDTTELTNIENRQALFMHGNVREWFKSLYIDDNLIKKYIKDSIVYTRTDFNKFIEKTKISKDKIKPNSNNSSNSSKKMVPLESKSKNKVKIRKVKNRVPNQKR